MCNFFSAIGLRNGDILYKDGVDSHSDLIEIFGLPDNTDCRHFAKLELMIPYGDEHDIDKYTFVLDEFTSPSWYLEMHETFESKCRSVVSQMIVNNPRNIVSGGTVIVGPNASIGRLSNARVFSMSGGHVHEMTRCTVDRISGGLVNKTDRCMISEMTEGIIINMHRTHVDSLSGGKITLASRGTYINIASGGQIFGFFGAIGLLGEKDCEILNHGNLSCVQERIGHV
jgi:hypothetical protein